MHNVLNMGLWKEVVYRLEEVGQDKEERRVPGAYKNANEHLLSVVCILSILLSTLYEFSHLILSTTL